MKVTNRRIQAMICNPWAYAPERYGILNREYLFTKIRELIKFLGRQESDWDKVDIWSFNEDGLIKNALKDDLDNDSIIKRFRSSGNKKHWKLIIRRIKFIRRAQSFNFIPHLR